MQRVCKSLRTVSDAELKADATTNLSKENGSGIRSSSSDISINSGQQIDVPSEIKTNMSSGNQIESIDEQLAHKKHSDKFMCSEAIWKARVPLKCKIFIWLAIRHCCWTADRL